MHRMQDHLVTQIIFASCPFSANLKKDDLYGEQFARTHSITFNPNKSKVLRYNVDETDDIPQIYPNSKVIPSVGSDKYLGNYISTDCVCSVYDLYQRNNWIISDFRVCDSSTYLR